MGGVGWSVWGIVLVWQCICIYRNKDPAPTGREALLVAGWLAVSEQPAWQLEQGLGVPPLDGHHNATDEEASEQRKVMIHGRPRSAIFQRDALECFGKVDRTFLQVEFCTIRHDDKFIDGAPDLNPRHS